MGAMKLVPGRPSVLPQLCSMVNLGLRVDFNVADPQGQMAAIATSVEVGDSKGGDL